MNLEQIKAGFAWHYKKYQIKQMSSDHELYSQVEIEAKETKCGLWYYPEPIPPLEYRQIKRK